MYKITKLKVGWGREGGGGGGRICFPLKTPSFVSWVFENEL